MCDDPPGARSRAQERARELLGARSALAREWWRFEAPATLDCVLITGRLVVTIVGKDNDGLSPTTPWYPQRTELVRALEAARQMATGRRYATLLLSDRPLAGGTDEVLADSLPQAAPHLGDEERAELRGGYLGNLTWANAGAAVELPVRGSERQDG